MSKIFINIKTMTEKINIIYNYMKINKVLFLLLLFLFHSFSTELHHQRFP